MVKIQVFGSGLIPRIGSIAPKKESFDADLDLIKLIMNTGTMKVKIINPITGSAIPVTHANLNKVYKACDGKEAVRKENKPLLHPVIPENKPVAASAPQTEVKVETPNVNDNEKKEEEKKDDVNDQSNFNKNKNKHGNNNSFKPVMNPEIKD